MALGTCCRPPAFWRLRDRRRPAPSKQAREFPQAIIRPFPGLPKYTAVPHRISTEPIFAASSLQIQTHDGHLAFGYTRPAIGRVTDLHRLETVQNRKEAACDNTPDGPTLFHATACLPHLTEGTAPLDPRQRLRPMHGQQAGASAFHRAATRCGG